jgi:hypothetical protein
MYLKYITALDHFVGTWSIQRQNLIEVFCTLSWTFLAAAWNEKLIYKGHVNQ